MPFPPTFDDVWDITQPPDTQLANLLGQDIRNLKDDIMQRMSLLSGTFANRPTPETVNATWGGVGFGLLYFSTDTKQIFQWNGAAWVDISASFVGGGFKVEGTNIVAVTVANSAVLTPLQSLVLPANEFATPGQELRFDFNGLLGVKAGGGMTLSIGFYMDGTLISSNFKGGGLVIANNPWLWSGFAKVVLLTSGAGGTISPASGILSSQAYGGSVLTLEGGISATTFAFDTTAPHTFELQALWNVADPANTITQTFFNCQRIG